MILLFNQPIWGDMMNSLLKLNDVNTHINQFHILQGVSLEIQTHQVTVLLGRNGAGKTTTLRTIMGLTPASQGQVLWKEEDITTLPTYKIAQLGIGFVPEDQGIFPLLTVAENIKIAIQDENDKQTQENLEWILNIFPDLKIAWKRPAGHLSGGQKQMLSIARAFINNNSLLLIDEPSKGLAPIMVQALIEAIQEIKNKTTILLVEQNFYMASKVGETFYILDDGKTVYQGNIKELVENENLKRKHLGIYKKTV